MALLPAEQARAQELDEQGIREALNLNPWSPLWRPWQIRCRRKFWRPIPI